MVLPVNIVKGEGIYLIDSTGRKYLSFAESINILGYSNENLKKEIYTQIEELIHYTNELAPYRLCIELGENLLKQTWDGGGYIFTSSGSEANEFALSELGLRGNRIIVGLRGAYHGQLYITGSITNKKELKGVYVIPSNNEGIEVLEKLNAENYNMTIIIEPLMIHAGIRPLPKELIDYISKLSEMESNILISDEVYLSPAKLGYFYGFQSLKIDPHVITLGKSVGGGLPLGAILFRREVKLSGPLGITTTSQGGNRTACRAGLALLKEIERLKIIEKVRKNGEIIQKILRDELSELEAVSDIRGRGYIYGVELSDKFRLAKMRRRLLQKCIKNGLLISMMGENSEVIRLAPPLLAELEDWKKAIDILKQALYDLQQ